MGNPLFVNPLIALVVIAVVVALVYRWQVHLAVPPSTSQRVLRRTPLSIARSVWLKHQQAALMSHRQMVAARMTVLSDAAARATTAATQQQAIAIMQNERNDALLVAQAEALAALIVAKKVGQTEGIKLVFGVAPSSTSKRYAEIVTAVKAAVERRQPPKFPPLTEQERQFRQSAGLPVS